MQTFSYVVKKYRINRHIHRFIDGTKKDISYCIITARKRSLGQGNIFTPVCHSVHRGGRAWLLWGGHAWSLGGMRGRSGGVCVVAPGGCAWDTTRHGDTVNERAVRILLECILVNRKYLYHFLMELFV